MSSENSKSPGSSFVVYFSLQRAAFTFFMLCLFVVKTDTTVSIRLKAVFTLWVRGEREVAPESCQEGDLFFYLSDVFCSKN